MAAGLECFAKSGYTGARLTDIVAAAGITTGALYGHFESKSAFFDALFQQYGDALTEALGESASLREQLASWIVVSREYRGVVRASSEVLQRRPEHAAARQHLREASAGLLAWHLREPLTQLDARLVARMLADVLDQYAQMEAAEWIPRHDPVTIADGLQSMVVRGVYRR
jgi:AcrR family transcriptional regulator